MLLLNYFVFKALPFNWNKDLAILFIGFGIFISSIKIGVISLSDEFLNGFSIIVFFNFAFIILFYIFKLIMFFLKSIYRLDGFHKSHFFESILNIDIRIPLVIFISFIQLFSILSKDISLWRESNIFFKNYNGVYWNIKLNQGKQIKLLHEPFVCTFYFNIKCKYSKQEFELIGF